MLAALAQSPTATSQYFLLTMIIAALFGGETRAQEPETAVEKFRSLHAETRAIRRDIPLTPEMRKALKDGVRALSGRPGANYWQLEVDYNIDVTLDRGSRSLNGKAQVTIHNHSPVRLDTVAIRLDHNIFRPLVPRGASRPAEVTQGMVLTKLVAQGEEIPMPTDRSVIPSMIRGANSSIRGLGTTVARLQLATPIPSGETGSLEIHWTTKLPGGKSGRGHRMTQRFGDSLFQPTQWYPRIAKFDDQRGWDLSPYLGPAEFNNNFGRFDVRITVPKGWLVSATGLLQNARQLLTERTLERIAASALTDNITTVIAKDEIGTGMRPAAPSASTQTWHFVAQRVNDFAWATAEKYTWHMTRATIPGRGEIPIHMLYLAESSRKYRRAGQITRHALEFYSMLLAPYPFPQLTLQDGPSAGMEYPMVINSNQGAADHEAAHQWWPMMVGNNETRYAWMDEGLNIYMNTLSNAHASGSEPNLDGRGQRYGRLGSRENEPPLMWDANYAGPMYGFQAYNKVALMLSMLGGIVGDDKVQQALSGYAKAWAFKHPTPWDFAFYMTNALDTDLGWFWYSWLFTTDSVNGSIKQVERTGRQTIVTVRQDGQMPSPVVLQVHFTDEGPPLESMPNARMQDERTAIVTWPVDVWFEGQREFKATLDFGERRIEKILLDPKRRFPDANSKDNSWSRP